MVDQTSGQIRFTYYLQPGNQNGICHFGDVFRTLAQRRCQHRNPLDSERPTEVACGLVMPLVVYPRMSTRSINYGSHITLQRAAVVPMSMGPQLASAIGDRLTIYTGELHRLAKEVLSAQLPALAPICSATINDEPCARHSRLRAQPTVAPPWGPADR